MEVTIQKTYNANGHALRFVPIDNVPGFSHRVVMKMDGEDVFIGRDWLGSEFGVNAKNAAYYFEKHCAKA